MNFGILRKVLGSILIIEALLLLPSLLISLHLRESSVQAFLITILLTLLVGIFLFFANRNSKGTIKAKEGLAIVTIGWVAVSVFGALPFYLSGSVPTYVDALFETISGFTTTGASVISDVESLTQGILFWRSFTHWIGGMGILVFTLALLPALGIGGLQIFKAESPGPVAGKIVPRLKDTARVLYITYFTLTFLEMVFLMLGGMSLFEATVHSFATLGTGGFGIKNDSIGGYSSYIHGVITVFMILSGVSFALYFMVLKKRFRDILRDGELRLYLTLIFAAVVLICLNLIFATEGGVLISIRDAFFQVASIMTTTGFSTVDFGEWPAFSQMILVILMFVGGSAGSTAGGMKVIRILVVLKLIRREVSKIYHPRAMMPIKVGGKTLPNEMVAGINSFLALHLMIFLVSSILISLEGIDIISSVTSVAATLNNIGPGLGLVGPTSNYMAFSPWSKLLFSFLMLLGRLELYTIIALVVPKNWTRES